MIALFIIIKIVVVFPQKKLCQVELRWHVELMESSI